MPDATWKDLVQLLGELQQSVQAAPAPPDASPEQQLEFDSEKVRISNLLADWEQQAREECFSEEEQSDFVPVVLRSV